MTKEQKLNLHYVPRTLPNIGTEPCNVSPLHREFANQSEVEGRGSSETEM
jgi:hypothetical protein